VVDEADPHARRRESASIITRGGRLTDFAAHAQWAARALEELPGCRFAATLDQEDGRTVMSRRDGAAFSVAWRSPPDENAVHPSAAILASAVYLLDIGNRKLSGALSVTFGAVVNEAWIAPSAHARAEHSS
jgi:hypothetical protein